MFALMAKANGTSPTELFDHLIDSYTKDNMNIWVALSSNITSNSAENR
jgi:hypothetical protein